MTAPGPMVVSSPISDVFSDYGARADGYVVSDSGRCGDNGGRMNARELSRGRGGAWRLGQRSGAGARRSAATWGLAVEVGGGEISGDDRGGLRADGGGEVLGVIDEDQAVARRGLEAGDAWRR